MKNVINFRKAIIAFAILLTGSISAIANEDPKATAVELKYLGQFRNKPVFEILFPTGNASSNYVLNIRDEAGNSLYQEKINGSATSRKFMLDTDQVDDELLRVELVNRKNNTVTVYEINRNTRVVEEMNIQKL